MSLFPASPRLGEAPLREDLPSDAVMGRISKMASPSIAVIGSLNVDFITRTARVPQAGETLTANSFDTGLGGKGANQAVAAARLADSNVRVQMVGRIGEDSIGDGYSAALEREGIDLSTVRRLAGQKTGIANIIVEETTGENRILLATNANYAFPAERDSSWKLVPDRANVVVFQLEIPLQVIQNMHLATASGKHVILNPAPAQLLPDSVYQDIHTLVMNETELKLLLGHQNDQHHDDAELAELLSRFLTLGVKEVVILTLGGRGLMYATASGSYGRLSARKVNVVDTTAAGDTFVGAHAVKRAKHGNGDFDFERALQFATLAASKTVERRGAMAAIPYLREVVP